MSKRKWLVTGFSIIAVVLLTLTSLSNVIGYQTVQSSHQQTIKEAVNPRELLFQTICDIANNKEIQRIILKSQMSRGIFPTSEIPVVTKNQLRQMYILDVLLSRFIRTSRMQSMIGKYQFDNQEMQEEISTVIERNTLLNAEIIQLKNSECDCENKESSDWEFPIICNGLYLLALPAFMVMVLIEIFAENPLIRSIVQILGIPFDLLWIIGFFIGFKFNCWDFTP